MIKISDLETGKKYGFDLSGGRGGKNVYVEGIFREVIQLEAETYVIFDREDLIACQCSFAFDRLTRLVGPI